MSITSSGHRILFESCFRIVAEHGSRVDAVCRFCPRAFTVHPKCISNIVRHLAVFHVDEYTRYKNEHAYAQQKERSTQLQVVAAPTEQEKLNASKVELKTPGVKYLFENFFRIVSENKGKLVAVCKLCTDETALRGNLRSTSTFVLHLAVFMNHMIENVHF